MQLAAQLAEEERASCLDRPARARQDNAANDGKPGKQRHHEEHGGKNIIQGGREGGTPR